MNRRRVILLLIALALVAAIGAGVWASQLSGARLALFEAWVLSLAGVATAPSTLLAITALAIGAALGLWGLMARRDLGSRGADLFARLRRGARAVPLSDTPPAPWTGELPAALGERWLTPGHTHVLAGEPDPLAALACALLAEGATVLLVASSGQQRRLARAAERAGLERRAIDRLLQIDAPLREAELRRAISRTPSQGPLVVLLDGASALGGWWMAERPESRLVRLAEGCREALQARGAAMVMVGGVPRDRLLLPDAIGERLQASIGEIRLWDGATLRTRHGADGGLARWLVTLGTGAAWTARGERRRQVIGWLATALAVGALALALVSPALRARGEGVALLGSPDSSLPGSLWSNWWVARAISEGRPGDLLSSDLVYWPLGDALVPRFGNLLTSALATPFQALFGYPDYWVWFVAAALLANGLAATALARTAGASRGAAVVAGLGFAGCPPLLAAVADAQQQVFWAAALPMCLRAGLLALDGQRPRDGWLLGLWFGICALGSWFYALFAILTLVPVALQRAIAEPSEARRAARAHQIGRALRASLPFALAAGPLIAQATRGKMIGLAFAQAPSLLAGTPIGDMLLRVISAHSVTPGAMLSASGLTDGLLVLLGFGVPVAWLVLSRGRQWGWPAIAAAAAVLSWGPTTTVGATQLTLPYAALYAWLPFFSRLRYPDRLLIVGVLAVVVLAALLTDAARARLARPLRLPALALALALAAAPPWLSGRAPLSTFSFDPPDLYNLLGGQGALIELPLGFRETAILYQPLHGHALVNGPGEYLESQSRGVLRDALWESPVLRALSEREVTPFTDADLAAVHARGLRYILINDGELNQLLQSGNPLASDAVFIANRVDATFGPPIFQSPQHRLFRVPAIITAEQRRLPR